MNELTQLGTGGNLITVGGSIAAAIITLALTLPKILNAIRADRLEGNILQRLTKLEEKDIEQDRKIHKYAVLVTRLAVVTVKLEALLDRNGVIIPQSLRDELEELRKEAEEVT